MNRRKLLLFALVALALSLACELLIFNLKPLASQGDAWTPLPAPKISGDLAADRQLTLQFNGLNRELRWCHIAIDVRDKDGTPVATSLVIYYSDDGNRTAYRAGTVSYVAAHDHGSYFRVNSYGNVHDLTVQLEAPEPGCSYRLDAAEINGSVPFHISVPRIFGIFALLMLFRFLRPASALHDNRFWNRRRWTKGLCVALILLLNGSVLYGLTKCNDPMVQIPELASWEHHHQYAKLAQALSEGRTWIDTPEQSEEMQWLSEMDDPYDYPARKALFSAHGETPPWDTAFYDGHLYVYFGVVPVLIAYLPYYLVTGNELPTHYAVWAACLLALIAAFACMRALLRRYFPRTPFTVYVLLSLLLGNCTGVLGSSIDSSFYNLPVVLSLAFSLFALALWLSAAERWERALGGAAPPADPDTLCFAPVCAAPRSTGIGLRIVLGSLFAALVAGCRPQFLVFTALALPILGPFIRMERRRAVTLVRIVLFALPFLAAAIPLMYYNQIRFGSPFDFGANYNLTTNDMTLRGFRLTRLPDGLFSYLFALPKVQLQFPYLYPVNTAPIYMGRTISEPMFGGVLILFPFLWLLFAVFRARDLLREKKLRLFFLLPVILAGIVVIADTEMAGILWRYTGDFLALLYLPATLVFCALLEKAEPRRRGRLTVFLTAAVLFSLLVCVLVSVSYSGLASRAPVSYFRLKDFLSWG
ncbi:MAG: hypothetical protein J5789_05000 [Oscillospiraceae bacterium]|nr:hypothetical protein [Oscillospiraceae bacterium]